MNIGLYNVDSVIPNLALMKLAKHHRDRGDNVELFFPLSAPSYDKVYASKVFAFTEAPYLNPETMEIGGTGVDMTKALPPEIEALRPDYSIYPDFNVNINAILPH